MTKQEFDKYYASTTISLWPSSSPINGLWKDESLVHTLIFGIVPIERIWANSKFIDILMTGEFVWRVEMIDFDLMLKSLIEKFRLPITNKDFSSNIQLTRSSFMFILKSKLSSLSKVHTCKSFVSDSTLIHHLWLSAK